MTTEDGYVNEVLASVPHGATRARIEMDLRAHIAERIEQGQSMAEVMRQFGDPGELAESYLAAVPLVSASFWSRAAAKLMDFLSLGIGLCILFWGTQLILGAMGAGILPVSDDAKGPLVIVACVITLGLLIPGYFVIAEYLTDQTLGKRALGIRVVRESGARISLGQSFVRQLPLIGEFFLLDVLFALFTEKKQRAFELISKTRVVLVEDELTQEPSR
jgi:uncharacterized RDD family membrane protein YckC